MQHSRGCLPTATKVGFFSQACYKQDFYLQQHWELNVNLWDRHKTMSPVCVMEWISSTNSLVAQDEQVKTGTLKNSNMIQPSQNQNLVLISRKCRRGSSPPERHDLLYLLFSTLWLLRLPPLFSEATAGWKGQCQRFSKSCLLRNIASTYQCLDSNASL